MNSIKSTPLGTGIVLMLIVFILVLVGCEKGTLGVKGGTASGYVLDNRTLAGLSGVSITASIGTGDTKASRLAVSDSKGYYFFSDLRPGEWSFGYDKLGYQPVAMDATGSIKVVIVNNEFRSIPEVRMAQNFANQYINVKGILKDAKSGTLITLGTVQYKFGNIAFNNRTPTEFQTGFSIPAANGQIQMSIQIANYETYNANIGPAVTDLDLGVILLNPQSYKVIGVWKDVPGWVFQDGAAVRIIAYSGNRVVATATGNMNESTFTLSGIPMGTSISLEAQVKGYRMNGPIPVTPNSDFQGVIYQTLSLKTNFSAIMRDVRLMVNGTGIGNNERVGGYCNQTGVTWPTTIVTGGIFNVPRVVDLGVNQVPTGYTLTFTVFNVDDGTVGTVNILINDDGVDAQIVNVSVS